MIGTRTSCPPASLLSLRKISISIPVSYTHLDVYKRQAQGGSINGCYVSGEVKGKSAVSGILGSTHSASYPTSVTDCYARVSLTKTGTTKDIAGISGWNESTSIEITNCYSACIGEVRPIAGWSDGAVSYTHLDVYKRQRYCRADWRGQNHHCKTADAFL